MLFIFIPLGLSFELLPATRVKEVNDLFVLATIYLKPSIEVGDIEVKPKSLTDVIFFLDRIVRKMFC